MYEIDTSGVKNQTGGALGGNKGHAVEGTTGTEAVNQVPELITSITLK
ncbi:MAG: hypothetical protein IPL22_11045 [Bacteroidetes bacterium]|nr:hypothetical protein [Bacteroidota bacterium]